MKIHLPRHPLPWLGTAGALCLAILTACGGGSGASTSAASTGAGTGAIALAMPQTSGVVSGFGSVFVDGVEINDSRALITRENADGSLSNTVLQLGERVAVEHANSVASAITVQAAVMGAVSSINSATSEVKVAGQWVKANADATAGSLTIYGGSYTKFADIALNDLIEVHGSAVYSSTLAAYEVVATRIAKKSALTDVRVMGKTASTNTTAKTFAINGLKVNYSGATVVPTGTTVADGQTVTVWGPAGSLTTSAGVSTLTATRVRVLTSTSTAVVTSGTAQLGGLVSGYSASSASFEVQGVTVKLGTATVTPTGATLANGAYVMVQGVFAADGSFTATSVRVQNSSTTTNTAQIRLIGAIETFTNASSFVVRSVPVDASAINVATACPGVTLAAGVTVQVDAHAQAGTNVVLADRLSCGTPSTQGTQGPLMREMQGTPSAVDTTALSFTLTLASGTTQKVSWSSQTAFLGLTAATLSTTATVKVDGYLDSNSVFIARSIRVPGTVESDSYDPSTGGTGWTTYDAGYRNGKH